MAVDRPSSSPTVIDVEPEALSAVRSRNRIERTLLKVVGVIGTSALIYGTCEGGKVAAHEAAVSIVENETIPAVIERTHVRLGQEVNADAIASQIAGNHSSDRVTEAGSLVVDERTHNLKIGSSEALDRHFVVAGRTRQMIHPCLVGMYIEKQGEDLTLEEGRELALQDAYANLTELP